MLSAVPRNDAAHPAALDARAADTTIGRRIRIWRRLAVRIEHILESHPLGVEVQVDVSGGAVPVLADHELRCAGDVASRLIHVLSEQARSEEHTSELQSH